MNHTALFEEPNSEPFAWIARRDERRRSAGDSAVPTADLTIRNARLSPREALTDIADRAANLSATYRAYWRFLASRSFFGLDYARIAAMSAAPK